MHTFGLNGSITTHHFYLRYACQLSPPPYRPNFPRRVLSPATRTLQKLPCCGLFGTHRQRRSCPRIYLIRAYFCQGRHRETFSASKSAAHPLCTATCHLTKKQLNCAFCTVPSQETQLVMNWTSPLSPNDYLHVANKCRPKKGGGLRLRPPPLAILLYWDGKPWPVCHPCITLAC